MRWRYEDPASRDIPTESRPVNRPWLVLKHKKVTKTYRPASAKAVSPEGDSRILSWGTDGAVRLWDFSRGADVQAAVDSKSEIVGATVAKSAKFVAAWDKRGQAWLWNLEGNKPIPVPISEDHRSRGSFSPRATPP